jgi:type VI protein secretion system component VasF
MTLLDLAEPVFQYVCRLNRMGRKAGAIAKGETVMFTRTSGIGSSALDYSVVRSEIKALLDDFLQKGNADIRLAAQVKKVELPLIFFIDSVISESTLPFAGQWNQNRFAYDRNELAGDEKFFDLLEETLRDPGEDASERLGFFYVCIGLGFTGIYFKQPEYVRKTMLTIAPRIRHLMDTDLSARMCPEAYEKIDTRNLVQPPGTRLIFVGILFICFTFAAVLSYFWMYREASNNLSESISAVLQQDPAQK